MFSSRRYQPVSQQAGDSDSESDEKTLFTRENGSTQKEEWHFGVREYDLSQDLDLPRVRLNRHSLRKEMAGRGYSRKQALFGACLFITIVATVTALAVLFLMRQNITAVAPEEMPTDCVKAPKPVHEPGGSKVNPPCSDSTTTTAPSTSQQTTTTINAAPTEESDSTEVTIPEATVPETTIPKATVPETTVPEATVPETTVSEPTVPEESVTEPTDCVKAPKPVLEPGGSKVNRPCSDSATTTAPTDKPDSHVEKTTSKTSVPPTRGRTTTPLEDTTTENITPTSPLEDITSSPWEEPMTSPSVESTATEGESPLSVTSQDEGPIPSQDHSTTEEVATPTATPTPSVTTPSQDDQMLKNWSDKISSDISTDETPPTQLITMTTTFTINTQTQSDLPSDTPKATPTGSDATGLDWEQDFFPAMSESNLELFDMNQDGVMDVVMVEDISQCTARLVAMDGETGSAIWQKDVNFPAFAVRCELDVNLDGVKDCLVTGRGGGFAAIDSRDGSLLWEVDPSIVFPLYNFYFPLIVRDLDNDGVNDIINMHGGDVSYKPEEYDRSPGYLVVVSGKTGQSLMPPMLTPDGHESYMSPVLFNLNGKDELVVFGSGGETVPGSLWAISLTSIANQVSSSQSSESTVYRPFVNDSYHPCPLKGTDFNAIRPTFDYKAYDFQRPIYVSSASNAMRFCPRWSNINPIWNKYGVCLYELLKTEVKGVMVPPVLVDLDLDGIDDLVVSTFEGGTTAISGHDASTRLWDVHYPNTESYSVPTPLYYNQDSVPDLLIRTNLGEWHDYNASTIRLLDGRNGTEIWAFDSAHFGMMSSVSLASKSPGSDAMLFMTIGTPDTNTDPSLYDDTRVQRRVHRRDNQENADIVNIDDFDGEAEEMGDDNGDHDHGGVVDYDMDNDYMHRGLTNHDPAGLWTSTPQDQFPDPNYDLHGFMKYCGASFSSLTTYVWLVTREMIEGGVEIKPIAIHEPFLFTLPEAPPTSDTDNIDGNPPEGSNRFPPDNQNAPPPPSVKGGPITKRHEHSEPTTTTTADMEVDLKTLRCSHISAPLQVIATPVVGDLNSDGRLDVVYNIVWSSIVDSGRAPPQLKVFAFTLDDRYREMMGAEPSDKTLVDFDSFMSAETQPWNKYMGRYGNNTYHRS